MRDSVSQHDEANGEDLAPMPQPYLSEGPVLSLGLAAASWSTWFQIDSLYGAYQQEKKRLLATEQSQVLQALPGSEAPAAKAVEVIVQHLLRAHPRFFQRPSAHEILCLDTGEVVDLAPEGCHPIAQAALLVQEDLVLLRPGEGDLPSGQGGYVLEAACVCFPTRWDLPAKLGRPIWGIHEPVPGLNQQIGDKIDLFFARLRPGRLVERANWSLLAGPALYQPTRPGQDGQGDASAPSSQESLTLRVERQTLCKMEDGRILFTIRIHQRAVAGLARTPEILAALRRAVDALPPDLAAYKAVDRVRGVLMSY